MTEVDAAPSPGAPPPTTHNARIRYLDGWRGLAILLVVAGHFFLRGNGWVDILGLECFFVLSGRLMADILFVEAFPLPKFYQRRISRVFPGLAVFVILTWLLTRGTELAFKPPAVAFALTFTLNYAMVFGHGVAAIENLWSLCVEEHSYLLLGVLALLARNRRLSPIPTLSIVAALSIADAMMSWLVLKQADRAVNWRTDAHLASIFMSAALYLVLRKRDTPAWAPVLGFAVGLAAMMVGPDALRYSVGTFGLALAVNTVDRAPGPVRAALSWRGMTAAGVWSYSVYLWQQPFFRFMLDGRLPMLAALALGCAAGLASFFFVEQPARRWLNAHWKRSRKAYRVEADGLAPSN